MLDVKQKGVALGMAGAAVYSFFLFALGFFFFPTEIEAGAGEVTAIVARWLMLPALCLFAGIAFIARHRFFNENAIDGANEIDDHKLMSARAYLQNTLEQIVLLALTLFGFVHVAPNDWLGMIPVLCCSFVFCRILFAIGYSYGAPARAFGFAGTFYPTVLMLVLSFYFWAN